MLRIIEKLARTMVVLGGVVLVLLVVLTCASVIGRSLNGMLHSDLAQSLLGEVADWLINAGIGPITGDFEILEAGVAFSIFAFLPYCQLHGGHATVDVFTSFLPVKANKYIIAFWEVVLTAVILLITWRLYAGMLSKMGNGETTFLLQFPVWWGYAASFVPAVVACVVGLYCAIGRVAEIVTGRDFLPKLEGAVH
ncbi:TRAP transporter small permease [Actibacterium lipolyticum]|uniref:TRAP transporter small permease protein n=1 Tax=Actibacterium lipolyticum TaxID=1524263 RepID=A0A238L8A6_9RHOB|nr:TRAP transporter small permease [Actibacterium lipolyticum]SMX51237.1 Tripartite ATP-independent periplasmic transporters, DctQ component [Actibacterium lipolyticum]